jgi:leader peptidase (prepilin peptidase) / N-methyltransferase
MTALVVSALFILGAIIASFVGVVVARLYTGGSFLTGHSRCDACGTPLSPLSLVPIFSYVASRGRARCCGSRISLLAPLSEIVLGSLFVGAYLTLGLTLSLVAMLVALSLLLALVLYDLSHHILPTPLLYAFLAVSALTGYLTASTPDAFLQTSLIALLIAGSLLVLHLLSRGRAMGLADAPLALALALLVGPQALSGFLFSFWIGAVVGIMLLLKRPEGSRMSSEVPFAPFLACGFLLAYFTEWNLFIYIAASH